jgi:hypothetical protein
VAEAPPAREPSTFDAEVTLVSSPPSVRAIEPEAFIEPAPTPVAPVPAMLDEAPLPARYGVDECVAMAVDPTTLYVYWETRPKTGARARRALARSDGGASSRGAQGEIETPITSTLRVLVVEPTDRGPRVETRDFEVLELELGEYFVRDLPTGAILRAAIGLRAADRFLPIAHTLDVEAPPAGPAEAVAHEVALWSERETTAPVLQPPPVAGFPAAGQFSEPRPAFSPIEELDGEGRGAAGERTGGAPAGLGLSSAELAARRARKGGAGRGAPPTSGSWTRSSRDLQRQS